MTRRKYEREGLLAIDPRAFLGMFLEPPAKPVNTVVGDTEIVAVSGPLDRQEGDWCDSYDAILTRVGSAVRGPCSTIVMRVDSPGGVVSGCFETARAIRELVRASGKRLVCYVDGQACSAAYALASAADEIIASETSVVGSIGVIDTRVDATANDAANGYRFAFITSGSRKADGNPHQGISAAELIDKQGIVNSLASVFFGLVSDMRGVDAAPLEARCFVGADAKAAGLVDEIKPFGDLLASFAAKGQTMSKYSEARAALEEAAKGDDEEAKKAKKALAAMDGEPDGDEKKNDKSAEGDDGDKGKDPPAEDKKEEARAKGSVSASTAGDLASIVSEQGKEIAALKAANESGARDAFLASRADLDPSLRKVLVSKPLAEVKEIVNAIPKPKAVKPAATATVQATRGEGQIDGVSPSQSPHAAQMDAAMGITKYELGSRREGNAMVFGVMPVKSTAGNAGKDGAK